MRYHWGLGVGHLHAHPPTSTYIPDNSRDVDASNDLFADPELPPGEADTHITDVDDNMYRESDNPEMGLEDRDLEGWEDVESDTSENSNGNSDHDSEDDYGGIYE